MRIFIRSYIRILHVAKSAHPHITRGCHVALRTLSSQLPDANIAGFCTTFFEVGRHRTLLIFFDTKFAMACISLIFNNFIA